MTLSKNKGFTFIELMVVISIIGVLLGAGIVGYTMANKRSRDARRMSDLEQLRSALEMYRSDNSAYPSTSSTWKNIAIDTTLSTGLVSNYMPSLPTDPKTGFSYWYLSPIAAGTTTYCLTAFLEVTNDTGTCTGYATLPSGAVYSYGAKNP